jgi:hypothetical protein
MNTDFTNSMTALPTVQVEVRYLSQANRAGWTDCLIGKHIDFKLEKLQRYCLNDLEPFIHDVFLVAAAVEFCDRATKRRSHSWGRSFKVSIPVNDLERWNTEVSQKLRDVLGLLTGDEWSFDFTETPRSERILNQRTFALESEGGAIVMPFSDGLDSWAMANIAKRDVGNRLFCVRLGNSRVGNGRQPFATLPYTVSPGVVHSESSNRSRGFKFALLSGVAAYLKRAEYVLIPESGQGALGPALLCVGHAPPDYRNHPVFMKRMTEFLLALTNNKIEFKFPRLWVTKGETVAESAESGGTEWEKTKSCWQKGRQIASYTHCGVCAACLLRRMSLFTAQLSDPPQNYAIKSLRGTSLQAGASYGFTKLTGALEEYAIAAVLHLDHFAELSTSAFAMQSQRCRVAELAGALGEPTESVRTKLLHLSNQHSKEWKEFVNNLGLDSFVRKYSVFEP